MLSSCRRLHFSPALSRSIQVSSPQCTPQQSRQHYTTDDTTTTKSEQHSTAGEGNDGFARTIVSGIQPTGAVHLGNYLGAVKQWVELQNKGEDMMLSIVDLHSITLPQDPTMLQHNILELTATLLACGVDPNKSTLFLQSSVPHHSELCWVLQCITTMTRLSRLPQFREKSQMAKDIPLGLFVYPVLQAADILMYKATHVPVGEDQLQHLQMAQHIVKTFNHRFGRTFPTPHSLLAGESTSRIKSLRDPSKKMSKSDPDVKSRIILTDSDDAIKKKLRKAVTDFTPQITYDPETRPGISNMINIHSELTGCIPEQICEEMEGKDTLAYKYIVADVVCSHVSPIREKIQEYLSHPEDLLNILEAGRVKATERAEITHREVVEKVGLGIPRLMADRKQNISKSI